jgi:predicted RNA-binding protein YlqC (UPF0109 family)
MTTDAQITNLLRDLVSTFVERPEALRVAAQPAADGACYFAMKGALEDESKLVGAGGSHVDALALLVAEFGRADQPPRDVIDHDPQPARELLCRVLSSLDVGAFAVTVGPGPGPRNSLTFLFEISLHDAVDYKRLTVPVQHVSCENATIVAALGTLFRAIAKKNGVRYNLTVKEPV